MIPQFPNRVRKAYSMGLAREDKENFSNNIQLQPNNKLAKLRESLEQCNHPEKIISSVRVDPVKETSSTGPSLKKAYSWQIKRDYSESILQTLMDKNTYTPEALKNHDITQQLRAKMVDWMIEVLSSYKMSEDAFFKSVKFMDLYFKKCAKKLEVPDLHLVGVASMFIASKYEEIYPFKINTIYDKICRKKFSKREIIDMEQEIISVFEFELQQSTCYDMIRHVIAEMELPLEGKTAQYLDKVSLYLAKMSMHCPELAWKQDKKLAAAVIYISLKTVEQVEPSLASDTYIDVISDLVQMQSGDVLQTSQQLLNLAKAFHKQYPSLTNLKKFNNAEFVDQN